MLEEALASFGREFFEKATEKVKEASDNSISFEMPKITLARKRTSEEEEEYRRIIKNLRKEDYKRVLEILELLGETVGGDYDPTLMQIRIAKEDGKNDAVEFELEKESLTHELMHSIRSQAIGFDEPVKNNSKPLSYGIPLEVGEFFSQLNAPACDSLEIKINKKDYPSLIDVSQGKDNSWKSNTMLDEIRNLKTLYDKSKKILEFRKRREVLEKTKKFEDREKYLYFAMGLPEEFALTAVLMVGYMDFSKYNPWQKEDIKKVNRFFEELMDEKKRHEWLEEDEQLRPYRIARLAIGNRYSEMVERWPRIMTADAKEVEAKYITPITTALNDMV